MISAGQALPEARLLRIGANGPEYVALSELIAGRLAVIFGLPGAFTPTCSSAHVPSFTRTADALRSRGVDEIICVSVNDPQVMRAWGEATGGAAAGIRFLADADSSFTGAIGMRFTAPEAGYYDRSRRYAMLVRDRVVEALNVEEDRSICGVSAGEAMLELLG